ncbi:MAG: protein kinase [Acidobacteriota bacterium]
MSLQSGHRLGPYEILDSLGAGGMGVVYRARDTRLGRHVAVKVLPAEFSADPERLRRFEQEARAVSALNHPNILTIHDVGSDGGPAYLVTELLEGQTLRQAMATGPLGVDKAIDFAMQMTRGLAAAHEKRIVHRDLKPENIFVTEDGRIKILDFGLAKLTHAAGEERAGSRMSTIAGGTEPGRQLGTVGYMSPEQVRGQPVDHRSDIFAFGTVLYEMLSGRRAFQGESAADTMAAILHDQPPALSAVNPAVPLPLEGLTRRCLSKDPKGRFQLACDLILTLEVLSGSSPSPVPPSTDGRPEAGPARQRSIAVLPFRDLAGDPQNAHLGLGLADATITELALVKSLLVRPTATILQYQDRAVAPQEAGRRLGVDAVVDVNFQRFGNRLRATVQLVGTYDGRSLWAAKIDTSLDDIFQMQDDVSRKIARALQVELSPADERRLARAARPGGEAYELYLKGRVHLFHETIAGVNQAIECFEKAREADPGYALAWAGLSAAYARMGYTFDPEGDWHERAERMCEKALELDNWLPEGRYLRAFLIWSPHGGWDHASALRELVGAIAGRPSLTEAHDRLGVVLFHIAMFQESEREFERALAINPEDTLAETHLATCWFFQGRYGTARERLQAVMEKFPWSWAAYQQAHCEHRLGLLDAAERTTEIGMRQFPGDVLFYSIRGLIAASRGDRSRAQEQVQLTIRNAKSFGHYHHAQYDIACIHAVLGDKARALDWLGQAARNGFPCHLFFRQDPLWRSLRDDGAFVRLMRELETECDGYRKLHADLMASREDSS